MGKDSFEFARIVSAEEVAEYLTSLAHGLKRGEVSLESGERMLRFAPAPEVKVELHVKQKEHKGKVSVQIGWKPRTAARVNDLRVESPRRPDRS